MKIKEDYNKIYSKKDFYWGLKPNKLVLKSIDYLKENSKILDLGCGEGKNTFPLSKQGDVTAIDISKVGIDKLNEFSKKENLKIKAEVSDVNSFLDKCEDFDAIYAINVLQFINSEKINSTINKIKSKTNVGGVNVIASFLCENKEQKERAIKRERYLFDENELKEMYKDWEILSYKEILGCWETHGCPKHRHYIVKLIARKIR